MPTLKFTLCLSDLITIFPKLSVQFDSIIRKVSFNYAIVNVTSFVNETQRRYECFCKWYGECQREFSNMAACEKISPLNSSRISGT